MAKTDKKKQITVTTRTTESFTLNAADLIEILRATGKIPPEGSVMFKVNDDDGDDLYGLYVETTAEETRHK